MEKVWHDRNYRLEGGGNVWNIDVAEWRKPDGSGELRVYTVHGDVNDKKAFAEALRGLMSQRGLTLLEPVREAA